MIHTQYAFLGRERRAGHTLASVPAICMVLLVALAMPGGAAAIIPGSAPAAGPVVRCEPVSISGPVNQIVTADITIQDVVGLYGADVQVGFDASIVQVLDENPNVNGIQIQPLASFLKPEFVILNNADNVGGTMRYAVTQLNPTSPATGSGALMRFRFQPLRSGSFTMQFVRHDLADRSGQTIANTVASCPVTISDPGGATNTPTPTPTSTVTPTSTPTPQSGTAQISGWVFLDTNRNGVRDAGETAGLQDVKIVLLGPGGSVLSTFTGPQDGWYRFENLAAGLYTVSQVQPKGYVSTSDDMKTVSLPGDGQEVVNFGEAPATRWVYMPMILR